MTVIPYLFFPGTCAEALEFYAEVFGGQVTGLMRFRDMPPGEAPVAPGKEGLVMNATLRMPDGASIMASDSLAEPFEPPRGTSLYVGFPEIDRARRVFLRLAEHGDVHMEFAPTFWSPGFGTCRDRYGTEWMIGVDAETPPA